MKKGGEWKDEDGSKLETYLCETFPLTASPTSYPSAVPSRSPTPAPTAFPTVPGATNAPSACPTMFTPSISFTTTAETSTFAPTTLQCPPTYTGLVSRCYKYVDTTATRSDALDACRADENGWLATLDETWKLDVATTFSIDSDTYFGLYKTAPCSEAGCDGNYAWDMRDGVDPPVGGYTTNMKR